MRFKKGEGCKTVALEKLQAGKMFRLPAESSGYYMKSDKAVEGGVSAFWLCFDMERGIALDLLVSTNVIPVEPTEVIELVDDDSTVVRR